MAIGGVDFTVDLNGDVIPAQAAALGAEAGRIAQEAFDATFNPDAKKGMKALTASIRGQFKSLGATVGRDFSTALAPSFRGVGDSFHRAIGSGIRDTETDLGELTVVMRNVGGTFRAIEGPLGKVASGFAATARGADDVARTVDRAGGSSDRYVKKLEKATKANDGYNKSLGTNAKQIIAIIVAIAAGAPEIAALGSVIGSTLVLAATSALALGAGLAVTIAAFQGMTGPINDVAKAARPAAIALQSLSKPLGVLQDQIQGAFFANLAGPLNSIKGLISALSPAIVSFSGLVGNTLGTVISSFTSGPAITAFQTLLAGFGPIFTILTNAAVSFGGAIGNILVQSLPSALLFAAGIQKIGDSFLAWTQSEAGIDAITKFFQTGQQLAAPLLGLVGSLATSLSSLVTPDAIQMTRDFLTNLSGFLPALSALLSALGGLDLFGNAALLLNLFGQAITPLMPQLALLANTLGSGLTDVIEALAPVLGTLLAAVLPLANTLGQFLVDALLSVTPLLAPIADLFAQLQAAILPIVQPILAVATSILDQLLPALAPLISAIGPIITPLLQLAGVIISAVLPAIQPLIDIVVALIDALSPILALIGPLVSILVDALAPAFAFLGPIITGLATGISDTLVPVIKLIGDILQGLISFIVDVFQGKWSKAWNDISSMFTKIWADIKGVAQGAINGIIDLLNGITGGINIISSKVGIPAIPKIPHVKFASGGIADEATFGVFGEAGPEALVPLNRPLSQVDPDVRALSAFAQGLPIPGNASASSSTDNRRSVTLEAGAVVISTRATDGAIIAKKAIDEIVANL